MFYDTASIIIKSGRGGDGCVTGRREAKVPRGGPAGGNGGKGGDVVFQGNKNLSSLYEYVHKKELKAQNGEPGRSKDQYGADAPKLICDVPLGTRLIDEDTQEVYKEILYHGDQYIICKGGHGGAGNKQFTSPYLQYPEFALFGEPGDQKNIRLELAIVADVGLIGAPSVGKTTMINRITNTKAKIAAYHFTTTQPNIGVVKQNQYDFTIVDIPGLIRGANNGKGLGIHFLRHVQKTKVFVFFADASRYEQGLDEMITVLQEVLQFLKDKGTARTNVKWQIKKGEIVLQITQGKEILFEKICLLCLSKIDIINDKDIIDELSIDFSNKVIDFIKKYNIEEESIDIGECVIPLSSATGYGIDEFLTRSTYAKQLLSQDEKTKLTYLQNSKKVDFYSNLSDYEYRKHILIKPVDSTDKYKEYLVTQEYMTEQELKFRKVRTIQHKGIARLVYQLPRGNDQAENWFWGVLKKQGHLQIMYDIDIRVGDILHIVSPYLGNDDRFIVFI